ncbi:unnamed protein product [Boreogadus saida]
MGKKIIHSSGDIVLRNQAIADQDISGSDDSEREEDENTVRGNWTNKREYLLSMIGMAVGLGNIWRFPYLAYKNGGGAFLIPYFIMLICLGVPLYFLETALGQFCSQGPINTWSAVPLLQGVGMAGLIGNVMVSIYYGVILSYTLYYLFASFQYPLPWTNVLDGVNCTSPQHVALNVTSMSVSNWTRENRSCTTANITTSSTEQYWDQVVLQRSSGLGETGSMVWQLALCLLLSSIIIAAVLLKGIKSSGKVVYFTATFPYVVLTILLIRGLTLEGAKDGIDFYIGSKSNLTKLAEIEVWRDAATQIFYSLSVGFGGVTALSSYNKFQNNLVVDTFLICIINCATSIFAGFAIFSILGYMAHIYGIPIEEVTKEGGHRFIKDIEMMIGTKSVWFWLYWRLCWYFITPFVTLIILVLSLAMSMPPTYGTVEYPAWGLDLGWCMAVFCIVLIPATALYKLAGAQGSFRKRLRLLCSPSEDWHPYLDVHRGERYAQERSHTGNVVDDEPSCHTCCIS